jgi:hypothetical protein
MPKLREPGKSGVTPCKHSLLNSLLGMEMGVLSTGALDIDAYLVLDMTAGDAEGGPGRFTTSTSPGICARHVGWASGKIRQSVVDYRGYEIQPATFSRLVDNCNSSLLGGAWSGARVDGGWVAYRSGRSVFHVFNDDSTKVDMLEISRIYSGLFLYNDPNHINNWCLSPEILSSAPDFTTSLSTLGCNVGGAKRMSIAERLRWYEKVNEITGSLVRGRHDACLMSVGNKSQWAYLVTCPSTWRRRVEGHWYSAVKKIEASESCKPEYAWMKAQPGDYARLLDYLFLTKKEREGVLAV